jgi:hypothetical protein
MNTFKAYRDVFCYAEGAAEIQVSLHRDLDAFRRYAHSGCHHLASDLRTSRQSPKQKVTGTSAGASASDSLVGLGLVDGTSEVDGA